MNWKRRKYRAVIAGKSVVWVIILAVILLSAGILVHQSSGKAFFYEPTGYINKVRALVDQGIVKYNRKTGKIIFHEKKASKNVQDFFKQSYLKRDIQAFNEGNFFGTFNIKGGKIQLDIRARRVKLPYTVIRHWTGDLYYRNLGTSAMLENDRLHLQVMPAPRNLLPLKARNYDLVPVRKGGFHSQFGFLLQYNTRKYFAQIEYIGDSVVLGAKHKPPFLSVNNYKIPRGNNVRLDDGDIVYFYDGSYKDKDW